MSSGSPVNASALASHEAALAASRAFCARVTARQARNFYYGMMLTPRHKRAAMYAIYTWMRAVDDLADDDGDNAAKRRRLEAFRGQTHAALRGGDPSAGGSDAGDRYAPMWPAVADALQEHRVPGPYLDAMIDGQLKDLTVTGYADFAELYDYCYQVASVVGLTCITVWGYEGGESARRLAEERGVALQLTNILRDLVEDARRNRVYLPADELAQFGFDAASFKGYLLASAPGSGSAGASPSRRGDFDGLMRFQLERARGYYDRTAALESFVTRSCRPTCWAMMKIYEALLRRIERHPRVVLTRRVRLSRVQKLAIAARATLRRGLPG
jgi:phytoene synthase